VHETGVRRKIPAIGADEAGDVWMLNEEGTLVRARDGATCALPNNDGVAQLAQAGHGKLWVTSGGQLAAVENGRLTVLTDTNNSKGIGYYVHEHLSRQSGGAAGNQVGGGGDGHLERRSLPAVSRPRGFAFQPRQRLSQRLDSLPV
jgi:ligand-binding sensor domain-containing protein